MTTPGGGDEDVIAIIASLRDELSRPALRAAEALDELRGETRDANAELIRLQREALEAAAAERVLERQTRETNQALAQQAAAARVAASQQRKQQIQIQKTTAELDKQRLKMLELAKVGKSFGIIMKLMKLPLIAAGATILAGALGAVGAALVGVTAAAGPALGVLAAYPGMLAAVAQGFVTVQLGFKGMGEAIKVLSDPEAKPEDIAKAMAGMTQPARDVAFQMASLKKEAEGLRKTAQNAFMPGFSKMLQEVPAYLPIINKGIRETGLQLNYAAQMAGSWMGEVRTQKQFGRVMSSNAIVVGSLARGAVSVVGGLLNILDSMRPMMQRIGSGFERWATSFKSMTDQANKSGAMTRFFDKAVNTAQQLWRIVKNLAIGLFGVGKAGSKLGGDLLTSLEKATEKFREFSNSADGQKKMFDWFEKMRPIIYSLSNLIVDVSGMFLRLSVDPNTVVVLEKIRLELLPAIEKLITGVGSALGPQIVDVATQLATALQSLPFSGFFMLIGAVISLLTLFNALPGPVKSFVGAIIAGALAGMLFFRVGMMLFNWGKKIWKLIQIIRLAWAVMMLSGMGPMLLVIGIIAALVIAFVILYKKVDWFRAGVKWVVEKIVGFFKWLYDVLVGHSIIPDLVNAIIGWFKKLASMFTAIFKAIWSAVKWVWDRIGGAAKWTFDAILFAVRIWWFAFKTYWTALWTTAKWVFDKVSFVVRTWFETYKWIFKQVWQKGKWAFDKVLSVATTVVDALKTVWGGVTGFFKGIWDGVQSMAAHAFNMIAGFWNNTVGRLSFSIPGWVPGIGGKGWDVPDMPTITIQTAPVAVTDASYQNMGAMFTGGPVSPGMVATVNELGPEGFMDRWGNMKPILDGNFGVTKFTEPGTVIPADIWSNMPQPGPAAPQGHDGVSYEDMMEMVTGLRPIQVGPIYPQSEFDIEVAVLNALRKAERERRERSNR